jgi:cystathionine beta-lyase/cystathionine gamma-synthase
MKTTKLHDETVALIGGYEKSEALRYNSFSPPLSQTVTFPLESAETARRSFDRADPFLTHVYTRRSNPTNDIFEKRLALLEGGEAALATSSGMAAVYLIANHLLEAGAACVVSNRTYSRVYEIFTQELPKFGVITQVVTDPTDLKQWREKIDNRTRFLYVETPSNPGLVIADITALANLARGHGIPLIVDNTLASPVATKPLALGAAAVIESVSKYISGNATILEGGLICRADWIEAIRRTSYVRQGMTAAPFNSWLALLGLETLALRMARHTANALKVAEFLQDHPKVGQVNYPGLKSHPQHELAQRQMQGLFGGVLSFVLKNQDVKKTYSFLNSLGIITLAIHICATRSMVMHPASTNFADLKDEGLAQADIPPGLVRLSVGLEHADDLIQDLDQALSGL